MKIEPSHSTVKPDRKAAWCTPQVAAPVIVAAVIRFTLLGISLARNGTSLIAQGDTDSYLSPGRNLLLHGSFVADGAPDLLRTPGYPLFLAITSVAGLPLAAVVNVILSLFTVILVWRLGRAAFDDSRIALGAAWLFAFEPTSVTWSLALVTETLFLALFLLSLERLAEFLRRPRLRLLVEAGLWIAAATFVRPVTYYLPIALALGLFLALSCAPGPPGLRQGPIAGDLSLRWKAPALLLMSVLPWLAAWQIRNWVETDYSGFSSIAEVNLYFFDAANVTAEVEHRDYAEVKKELGYLCWQDCNEQTYLYQPYLARNPGQAGWSQGERLAFMHSEAMRVIVAHYGVYVRSCLTSLAWVVFEPGTRAFDAQIDSGEPPHLVELLKEDGLARGAIEFARAHPWATGEKVMFETLLLGLYLFAARGVFRSDIRDSRLWLLLGTVLYFFAVVGAATGGQGADSRYRQPVMPIVCILAATGFRSRKIDCEMRQFSGLPREQRGVSDSHEAAAPRGNQVRTLALGEWGI